MKIHVRSRHIELDQTERRNIERRLLFSLGRLSAQIARALVQIVDINGPRGGEDKVCRIEVRLRGIGTIFVDSTDADLSAAVDRAAHRAAQAVARALERAREAERKIGAPPIAPTTSGVGWSAWPAIAVGSSPMQAVRLPERRRAVKLLRCSGAGKRPAMRVAGAFPRRDPGSAA